MTVLAPVAGGVVPYTITVETIAGAGGEFIFNWSDDSYALPLSIDAIVTFQLGSNKKETQPWARTEGEGLRAYMSTVGADWSQTGEKDFYVRVKATSGKMYDIIGILTVADTTGEVSEIEVKVVENITPSETKVSFDSASADAVEVTITAEGFTPDAYSAESDDESVAVVSVSGNKVTITPVADGDAVVTVTANGKTAEIKVHVGGVENLVGNITFNKLYLCKNGWGDYFNNVTDYSAVTDNFTLENNVATLKTENANSTYMAQLFLNTEADIEGGKEYTVSFKITGASGTCVFKAPDGGVIADENVTFTDGEVITRTGTAPATPDDKYTDLILFFDFGRTPNSTITISDIVITSN